MHSPVYGGNFKGPLVNDFEHGCHVWFCGSVEDRRYSAIHLCVSWRVRIFEEFGKKLWNSPSHFSEGVKDSYYLLFTALCRFAL
jgi:hypothetical protein